jgi:uncharacterized membrane protein
VLKQCPKCSKVADAYAPVCPHCGHRFRTPPPAQHDRTQFFGGGTPAQPSPYGRRSNAQLAFILSIVSWFAGTPLAIVSLIYAKQEMDAISRGELPPDTYDQAKSAYWISIAALIAGAITTIVILIWLFVMAGSGP